LAVAELNAEGSMNRGSRQAVYDVCLFALSQRCLELYSWLHFVANGTMHDRGRVEALTLRPDGKNPGMGEVVVKQAARQT
jgi:hypothetical protein